MRVDGHDPVGMVEHEVAADVAADVPAHGAKQRIAEDAHELRPTVRRRRSSRGAGRWGGRSTRSPACQHDHVVAPSAGSAPSTPGSVEVGMTFMSARRVRPAVAEDQRQDRPSRSGGPDVHEVDARPSRRTRKWGTGRAPPPARASRSRPPNRRRRLAQVGEVGPERPARPPRRRRADRSREPRAEVLEHRGGGLRANGSGRGGASGMGLTVQAAPRYPTNALSRRPSQPPASPKRAAWAVVAGLAPCA